MKKKRPNPAKKHLQLISIAVYITGCCISFSGCIPDYNYYCGEFESTEEIRSFFAFGAGTKWIYENQSTLEKDTFTVVSFFVNSNTFSTSILRSMDSSTVAYYLPNNSKAMDENDCIHHNVTIAGTKSDGDQRGASGIRFPLNPSKGFRCDPSILSNGNIGQILSIEYELVLGAFASRVVTLESELFGINATTTDRYRYQFGQGVGLISFENLDSLDGKWQLISFQPVN